MKIERKVTFERNGKTVRRTVRANSEAEFNEKYNQILAQAAKESEITFTKICDEWEENHFKNIAYGTKMCYAPAIRRAKDAFGELKASEVTPKMIEKLLDDLARQRYSARTVKTQKVVIGLIYKYAVLNGKADKNPAEYVPLPKNLKSQQRTPPKSETIEIIKSSVSVPFGLFPYFLLYTGCRRGEALAIRWEDIDFHKNTITICRKVVFQNNKPVVENHLKTKAGEREIPLILPLKEVLEPIKMIKGYIFIDDCGNLLTERQYVNRLNAYKKTTGADFTPHQLRHEYATILYDAGIDEKMAQSIMGHSDISVTQNIYTHIRESRLEGALNKLNSHFNS